MHISELVTVLTLLLAPTSLTSAAFDRHITVKIYAFGECDLHTLHADTSVYWSIDHFDNYEGRCMNVLNGRSLTLPSTTITLSPSLCGAQIVAADVCHEIRQAEDLESEAASQ